MREIKFRAQDIASNKWLYGDLRHHKDDICIFGQGGNKGEQVKNETIGQFTGLHDKDKKPIFEGDIIRAARDNKLYSITFRDGMFYASIEEANIFGGYPLWCLCDEEEPCTIVGNIYENPELLKK